MFKFSELVYIDCISPEMGGRMGTAGSQIVHKHFRLDAVKLKRAKRILKAKTETEAVERAIDLAIAEHERDRAVRAAHERFLRSGIAIHDVYGVLE